MLNGESQGGSELSLPFAAEAFRRMTGCRLGGARIGASAGWQRLPWPTTRRGFRRIRFFWPILRYRGCRGSRWHGGHSLYLFRAAANGHPCDSGIVGYQDLSTTVIKHVAYRGSLGAKGSADLCVAKTNCAYSDRRERLGRGRLADP